MPYEQSLQAFKNIIAKTDVNIIAPQDSMGTGFTKTAKASGDHYRALADAKKSFPSKNVEVWANIELFQKATQDTTWKPDNAKNPPKVIPAPFARVRAQIEAARPHVSKMTSWEYQHNMMILSSANNLSSILTWNSMYTPALATRRAKLRADYLAAYSGTISSEVIPSQPPSTTCKQMYYYNKNNKLCVATSDTYNSSQVNCVTGNTCTQNLNLYLKGITTGICYSTFDACKDSNASISQSPSPTPTNPTTKPSDLNKDGKVNLHDYQILTSSFGKTGAPGFTPADLNKDGKVNLADYNIFIKGFGK